MTTIDDTLNERGKRYGDFADHAVTAQRLQDEMRAVTGWTRLDAAKRQALTVIADKIARILTGDPNYADNWHDIQGYARLVELRLEAPKPDADGWIEWCGGECPVGPYTLVRIRLRNGREATRPAGTWCWKHRANTSDIVAYHIVKEAPGSDADGWFPWHGGECPVVPRTRVHVLLRDGAVRIASARIWDWRHYGITADIVAYRIARDTD